MAKNKPWKAKVNQTASSKRKRKSSKPAEAETVLLPPPPLKKTKLEASSVLTEISNDNQPSCTFLQSALKCSSSKFSSTLFPKTEVTTSDNLLSRSLRSSVGKFAAVNLKQDHYNSIDTSISSKNSVANYPILVETTYPSQTVGQIPDSCSISTVGAEATISDSVVEPTLQDQAYFIANSPPSPTFYGSPISEKRIRNDDPLLPYNSSSGKLTAKETPVQNEELPHNPFGQEEQAIGQSEDLLESVCNIIDDSRSELFQTPLQETPAPSRMEECSSDTGIVDKERNPIDERGTFQLGNLVWAALTGFPLWPAIVASDPLTGTFYKEGKNGQGSLHVRFFGDGKRSWTLARKALTFEGVQPFLDKIQLSTKPSKKNKTQKDMYVSTALLGSWRSSASQAEEYLSIPREEVEGRFLKTIVKPEKLKSKLRITRLKLPPGHRSSSLETIPEEPQTGAERSTNSDFSTNSLDSRKRALPKKLPTLLPFEEMLTSIEEEFRKMKSVKVCQVCEQTAAANKSSKLLRCKGLCRGYFHLTCLGISDMEEMDVQAFKCPPCSRSEGNYCQDCKNSIDEDAAITCSVTGCGKQFHRECLVLNFPQVFLQDNQLICPSHLCPTCTNVQDLTPHNASLLMLQKPNDKMLLCIRCPTAYHSGSRCLAAGSIRLSSSQILCARHRTTSGKHSCNVNWCFSCSRGGSLVCCENCPAAFHAECAGLDTLSEEKFLCPTCKFGKTTIYGDIVWAKVGYYRWWPARVLHMEMVPGNVLEKDHGVGDFCVQFFGSYDFAWVNSNRVFLFQDGDGHVKGMNGKTKSKLVKCFAQAIREANESFVLKEAEGGNVTNNLFVDWKKPPPYVKIKSNRAVGKVKATDPSLRQTTSCECLPSDIFPCSDESNCLNRIMMIECHAETCPAKDNCQNQRFQKREYPPLTVVKTAGRGWGLKGDRDIKQGEFVIEYVGEIIDEAEYQTRLKKKIECKDESFYFLTLDANRLIDAGPKGNLARFINHSCQPNCQTQKWTVNGDTRVGIFALTDIPTGTELTFNYQLECAGDRVEKAPCLCGAPTCSGFIGVKPKSISVSKDGEKEAKKKVTKKNRKSKKGISSAKKYTEDDCFRCGEGGELIMCDMGPCPKVYHLECLNLSNPPRGTWSCPWHHCDECGKRSSVFCTICPNSLCKMHAETEGETKIHELPFKGFVCEDHDATEDVANAKWED